MKSRTSSFKTILRKDILRFAPLWALYLIGGILVILSITDTTESGNAAMYLSDTIGAFSIINLIYAALVVQLLFGDLFNSRLCNALHAMPMRRETWFLSHVISGLCYSMIPNLIGALVLLPRLEEFWFIGFIWLLGMTLEYLFFFGLAVFSTFCTGNRFAMAAVYAILNFISMIAWWFVATIYEPLIYGVSIPTEPFVRLCPVVSLCDNEELVLMELVQENLFSSRSIWQYQGLGEGWGYLAVTAVIGVALLALPLLMYRRRALESAGDFMAVRPLAPVFSVVYTLCMGAVFALFGDLISGGYMLFLIIGIAVGHFTGQMLLQRTVKVFKPMAFVKLAVLAAVMVVSIFVVKADPIGVTRWVPEKDQVEKVMVSNTSSFSSYNSRTMTLLNAEDIEKIIQLHENIIDHRDLENADQVYNVAIRYYLENGTQVERVYQTGLTVESYKTLALLYSKPEIILGYTDWEEYLDTVESVYVEGYGIEGIDVRRELLEAVKADCEAGTMTQNWSFRQESKSDYCLWIQIELRIGGNNVGRMGLDIYSDAENTLNWLKENQDLWNLDKVYTFD